MTEPPNGFDSPQLAQLFSLRASNATRPAIEHPKNIKATLAASLAGAFGLLLIIGFATWFVLRKRRQRSQTRRQSEYLDAVEEPVSANELSSSSQVFEKASDAVLQEIGVPADKIHEMEQPATVVEKPVL